MYLYMFVFGGKFIIGVVIGRPVGGSYQNLHTISSFYRFILYYSLNHT